MAADLDTFLNAVGFSYCTDPSFQDVVRAAGIDFKKMPTSSLGTETVLKYEALRESESHEVSRMKVQDELNMLDNSIKDFRQASYHPSVLRHNFNEYYVEYQYEQLGKDLLRNAKRGKEIINQFESKKAQSVDSAKLEDFANHYLNMHLAEIQTNQVETAIPGFNKLTEMIGGFNPERIAMLLGATGYGKTNFCLNLALNARESLRVAYVNMEMGYKDMSKRVNVIISGVSYQNYKTGNFDPDDIRRELSMYKNNFDMTSGRGLSVSQIESWVKFISKDKKIDLLFIDYDQKLKLEINRDTPEWKAIQQTIERLEEFSKEMQCFILVAAQLNRDGQISASHRSTFHADTVLYFYNDSDHGSVIAARKNRHGKKNQAVKVFYDDQCSQIRESEIVTLEKNENKKAELKPTPRPSTYGQFGLPYKD